jgi:predicted porin
MNKNIKLAVAGAVLALSATAANAGIVIPAGEWTLDVSGNVNMYTNWSKTKGQNSIEGGIVAGTASNASKSVNAFGNGLLPNFLSVSGSTRQNDLDVSFTISLQPGSANNAALQEVSTTASGSSANTGTNGGLNNRQAFITFGDKSWGSFKVGKDLGIFASDAILSDITLLGVGGGTAGAGNTSLGRIGFGYIYADWKPQIAYTTPNFNGFQATAGIAQAFIATGNKDGGTSADITSSTVNAAPAYEGKVSYSFNGNGVEGKVWVSGLAQKVGSFGAGVYNEDTIAYAGDIGAKISASGFEAVGYYWGGSGIGNQGQFLNGYGYTNTSGRVEARDSNGGYVQLAYTLPTKTKAALSWGGNYMDRSAGDATTLVDSNEMWNAMLIQPLTKHLNVVAEYSYQQSEAHSGIKNDRSVGALGAILFF